MTTFTDKELIKEIKERISSLDVRDNIERRAYEIALASLEADPVAWLHSDNGLGIPAITRSKNIADSWLSKGWYVQPLYIAKPVPVVPEGLVKAVRFYEQVKCENPPVETGAWKDAVDWVLNEACQAVNIGIKGE